MNPIIILEFILVYGNQISSVKATGFFQTYGRSYDLGSHAHGTWERAYLFLVLMIFSMMLSCFVLEYKSQDKAKIERFFSKRIRDAKYAKSWKFLFVFLKYIHTVTLFVLFIYGCGQLNNFKNLGFMLFFCFYTAYEDLYRKTSVFLIIFISIFVVGQYYFSLFYEMSIYNNEEGFQGRYDTMNTLSWFDMVPHSNDLANPYKINDTTNSYFRLAPQFLDWGILITLGLIVELNTLFRDKKKSEKMVQEAKDGMSDDFQRTSYYLGRVKRILKGVFIYCIILVMCIVQVNMQTNVINWLFFIVNIVNVSILVSGVNTRASFKSSELIARFIKFFSITIIVIDILFIWFIGEYAKDEKS